MKETFIYTDQQLSMSEVRLASLVIVAGHIVKNRIGNSEGNIISMVQEEDENEIRIIFKKA
jgi:hypothetical protein